MAVYLLDGLDQPLGTFNASADGTLEAWVRPHAVHTSLSTAQARRANLTLTYDSREREHALNVQAQAQYRDCR